jgi:hypothetical protein
MYTPEKQIIFIFHVKIYLFTIIKEKTTAGYVFPAAVLHVLRCNFWQKQMTDGNLF